jgi:hypothetical protein
MDDKPLQNAAALLGEFYGDYAILVKSPDGGVWWRTSNQTWAEGAMIRYQRGKDVWDRTMEMRESEG